MKKEEYKTGAVKGQFQPFIIYDKEIVLTSVSLQHVSPGDKVVLKLEIGWDKPVHWDMGEIIILIRSETPDGPIVLQAEEACFFFAHTKLEHTLVGGPERQAYYLSVYSPDARARITGPYSLEGAVYSQ